MTTSNVTPGPSTFPGCLSTPATQDVENAQHPSDRKLAQRRRPLTYQEIPQHYVWLTSQKKWKRREHGTSIGRLYFVSPTAGECFYLRTLLTTVTGVTSWSDIRSFNGIIHPTFHAACLAHGLLVDDNEWRECLPHTNHPRS